MFAQIADGIARGLAARCAAARRGSGAAWRGDARPAGARRRRRASGCRAVSDLSGSTRRSRRCQCVPRKCGRRRYGPRAPGQRGVAAAPALTLRTAPAISRLAGDPTLGERATRVLERISWPGKAGAAPAAAALTPAEQQRFTAGQTVYTARCQACHLPSGLGQPDVAPALLGSAARQRPIVAARADPAEWQGGAGRTDAAIRGRAHRRTGGGGAHLHPSRLGQPGVAASTSAFVTRVRAAAAGRTRPWTDADLAAIPEEQ